MGRPHAALACCLRCWWEATWSVSSMHVTGAAAAAAASSPTGRTCVHWGAAEAAAQERRAQCSSWRAASPWSGGARAAAAPPAQRGTSAAMLLPATRRRMASVRAAVPRLESCTSAASWRSSCRQQQHGAPPRQGCQQPARCSLATSSLCSRGGATHGQSTATAHAVGELTMTATMTPTHPAPPPPALSPHLDADVLQVAGCQLRHDARARHPGQHRLDLLLPPPPAALQLPIRPQGSLLQLRQHRSALARRLLLLLPTLPAAAGALAEALLLPVGLAGRLRLRLVGLVPVAQRQLGVADGGVEGGRGRPPRPGPGGQRGGGAAARARPLPCCRGLLPRALRPLGAPPRRLLGLLRRPGPIGRPALPRLPCTPRCRGRALVLRRDPRRGPRRCGAATHAVGPARTRRGVSAQPGRAPPAQGRLSPGGRAAPACRGIGARARSVPAQGATGRAAHACRGIGARARDVPAQGATGRAAPGRRHRGVPRTS